MLHVDKNDTLFRRIRAGDRLAIDEMILGNLALVKSRVGKFLKEYRRFRHLFDDLNGEGILALTVAINSFSHFEADKPTGYIVSAIDYALKNYIDTEVGAGMMSRNSVQHRRSRNESLPNQLPFDVAEPPARIWQNATGRVIRKETEHEIETGEILDSEISASEFGKTTKGVSHTDGEQFIARVDPHDTRSYLLDRILECCKTKADETILRLRIDGFNDADIGERLGLSRQTVNRRRKAIEYRFERMKKTGQ